MIGFAVSVSSPPQEAAHAPDRPLASLFTNLSAFDTVRALILQDFWLARVLRDAPGYPA
jgi:hypothetical protein